LTRPTNQDLCREFRTLLTEGFYVVDTVGEIHTQGAAIADETLAVTKPWRGDLWKAFRELEDRLCPPQKFARTGQP